MIKSISQSLEDIIGKEFIEAVSRGAAFYMVWIRVRCGGLPAQRLIFFLKST